MTMKNPSLFWTLFLLVVLTLNLSGVVICNSSDDQCQPSFAPDSKVLELIPNFEYLEGEFFMYSSTGKGLDSLYPNLAFGGPTPVGAQRANLDPRLRSIIEEFADQEWGNLRAVVKLSGGKGIRRPLLNLSKGVFADLFDKAFGFPLKPRFDPYANSINFLLAANIFPRTGLSGLVGAAPRLIRRESRQLAVGLLGVESGQDAVIRTMLYQRANDIVQPYNITVAEFVNRTSELSNRLGKCGLKDEGLLVPRSLGAENRTNSNILAADDYSLSHPRTTQESFRIVYGTGDESKPGGFFPQGANGEIAQDLIRRKK